MEAQYLSYEVRTGFYTVCKKYIYFGLERANFSCRFMALMHWKCVVEGGGSGRDWSNTEVRYETLMMIMERGGKFAIYSLCSRNVC
jgi:hypothetical protein